MPRPSPIHLLAWWRKRPLVLLCCFSLVMQIDATLILLDQDGARFNFSTFTYKRAPPFAPVDATGLLWLPSVDEIPPDPSEWNETTGKIAIVGEFKNRLFYTWTHSKTFLSSQFAAIILIDGFPNATGGFVGEILLGQQFPCPIAGMDSVSLISLQELLNSTANITRAVLDSTGEKSRWNQALESGGFWFIIILLPVLQIAFIILGVGRLIQFRNALRKFELNVASVLIIFELLGAGIRLVYWSVDPLGHRGIISDPPRSAIHTMSIPFSLSSTLLLTIYWHETLSGTRLRLSWSLENFRIPTYFAISVFFGIEIVIDSFILSRNLFPRLELINSAIYLSAALFIALFFIITAIRVLYQLRQIYKENQSLKLLNAIIPVATCVGLSALSWIGIIAVGIATTSKEFHPNYNPLAVITVWSISHLLLTGNAIATVLAVSVPSKRSSNHRMRMSTIDAGRTPNFDHSGLTATETSGMYSDVETPTAQSASLALSPRIYT